MRRAIAGLLLFVAVAAYATTPATSGVYATGITGDQVTNVTTQATGTFTATVGRYEVVQEWHCPQYNCSGTYNLAYVDSVTDTQGNTFTVCGSNNGTTTNIAMSQWYAKITTGGTNAVTVHSVGGADMYNVAVYMTEVTGVSASASCVSSNHANLPGSTTTPSLATSGSVACGDLVFGYIYSDTISPTAPAAAFYVGQVNNAYMVPIAAGAATIAWSSNSFNPYVMIGAITGATCVSNGASRRSFGKPRTGSRQVR